jgi:D-glucosaminate-specific PTS system IIB component
MAQISLFRVDFRLIHGQVITKWIKQVKVDRILIIDDKLFNDEFMTDVYRMAAPQDIPVEIFSVSAALDAWEKDKLGSGNLFVLVRDVKTTMMLKQNGFGVEEVQIGGLGGEGERVVILPGLTLGRQDIEDLQELSVLGCKISFHVIPAEPRIELDKALTKFNNAKRG